MDIRQVTNLTDAAQACDADPACLMFNDGGWLKNVGLEQARITSNSDPCSGLYVKEGKCQHVLAA